MSSTVDTGSARGDASSRHRPAASVSDGERSPEPEVASTEPFPSMGRNNLNSYNLRADPDAQATVTDFLDFTEYLPSDMARSLTLVGKLDEDYIDASTKVHLLTDLWSQLPNIPIESRPAPVDLRADISASLSQGLSSRVYAHAEALRMAENVNRHYFRAKTILSKLQKMLENYPEAEQQQQEQQQQKQQQQQREQVQLQQQQQQQSRGGQKHKKPGQPRVRRQRLPRITVPGEVLAPYELDYETYSGESDISSPSSDDESPPPMLRTTTPGTGTQPRIKAIKASAAGGAAGSPSSSTPKTPKVRLPRLPRLPGEPYISTSSALAKLKPPPENAVIGSTDAPWLQLTPYELAKLRKRMKKNAQWTPSETMIARELKMLGRNLDAFNNAKKRAEDEGRSFEGSLPEATLEPDGVARISMGALSMDAAMAAEDNHLSNRGMKLNEAKKLKNRWAQLAAQEAEESTRKMMEAARAILSPYPGATAAAVDIPGSSRPARATTPALANSSRKRKREGQSDLADTVEGPDGSAGEAVAGSGGMMSQRLQKRVKTETPVPIPQPAIGTVPPNDNLTPAAHPHHLRHSTTPVPTPTRGQPSGIQDSGTNLPLSRQSTAMSSPLSSGTSNLSTAGVATTTTTVPLKPPAETPIHPPPHKSSTSVHPPMRELRARDGARKDQQQQILQHNLEESEDINARRKSRASSRAVTPSASGLSGMPLPSTEAPAPTTAKRRPSSRGTSAAAFVATFGNGDGNQDTAATAQSPSLVTERSRRASTARNTPAPEAAAARIASKRVKRPAPGVVSRMSSGGSAAVGRRKAAPRKKRGSNAAQQRRSISDGQTEGASGDGDVDVDDDGNVIDPNEPRYCVCNRVSFGTMIQCDNVDNCKQEWFHLECVGMTAVPARTTKWYCPDCRVLLNIGEKGEVSARGVRM